MTSTPLYTKSLKQLLHTGLASFQWNKSRRNSNIDKESNIKNVTDDELIQLLDGLDMKPNEVNYVIYHGFCTDGFSSALFAYEVFGDTIKYHAGKFKTSPPEDIIGKNLLMVDFTYPDNIMQEIRKKVNKLAVLDHHKTAELNLQNVPSNQKVLVLNHSGVHLSYKYFNRQKPCPMMVDYIEDNDIWTHKLPFSEAATTAMYEVPFNFKDYQRLIDDEVFKKDIIEKGKVYIEFRNKQLDKLKRGACISFVELQDGKSYIVSSLNSSVYKSELGNILVSMHNFIDFALIYDYDSNGDVSRFSLRSLDDRESVSAIAEKWSGGGHFCASGCSFQGKHSMIPYYKQTIVNANIVKNLIDNINQFNNTWTDYISYMAGKNPYYTLQLHLKEKMHNMEFV